MDLWCDFLVANCRHGEINPVKVAGLTIHAKANNFPLADNGLDGVFYGMMIMVGTSDLGEDWSDSRLGLKDNKAHQGVSHSCTEKDVQK